jgi:hypothetical protein
MSAMARSICATEYGRFVSGFTHLSDTIVAISFMACREREGAAGVGNRLLPKSSAQS